MGDPWKSITPKGVQAFVNASIATLLVWLTVENHLSMVANLLVDLLSSKTFGLIVYYAIAVIILYKLLYKRSSYDVNEKRATKFAIISMILIWLVWEGYLSFLTIPLGMIGVIISFKIFGLSLGFMALMGVVALIGVVVNDSIVLVNFINIKANELEDLKEAIILCESVKDFVSRDLLKSILESEEEHVDHLETQLELVQRVGNENFLQSLISA